jgi:hypothetical protein
LSNGLKHRVFFSEEKKQKTFIISAASGLRAQPQPCRWRTSKNLGDCQELDTYGIYTTRKDYIPLHREFILEFKHRPLLFSSK